MWPDSSPAWRKRQPNTKPRLGINRNPPIDPSTSSSTPASKATDPVFPIVDPLIFVERQVEDEEGLAGEDEAAPAVTYNNGLWTPPASISIATPTPPGFTATILLAPTSASEDLETSKNLPTSSLLSSRPSATLTSQHTSLHYSSSELSSTSSSTSSTSIPSALPKKQNPEAMEASKRARYDARASRQAKKREMQAIKTMWGYDRTPVLPDELEPGQHDLHYSDPSKPKRQKGSKLGDKGDSSFGSDSESGVGSRDKEDERYPGTFKILSLALLGEGSKPEPPQTRGEGGRKYETGVQNNSWFAVKIKRWVGADPQQIQAADEGKYTVAPNKQGSRRLKHALSRERMRDNTGDWNEKENCSSPATTLSVGSGEMKYKAEFEAVDLDAPTCTDGRYTSLSRDIAEEDIDDPFLTKQPSLGWRKPLAPQPKESPFRPAILNFGLRSRSKTYDAVSPAPQDDTPVKASRFYTTSHAQNETLAGFFGLGISGVWKAVTGFTSSQPHQQMADEEDEESFVARPCRPYSEVMSENDTPYSTRRQPDDYIESGTPTKAQSLNRTGTVLNVKSTNQPWSTSERKMTTAAFNEALLASPANKQVQHSFRPLVQQSPSPTKQKQAVQSLAPRKSLLLQQAIAANNGGVGAGNGDSPAFTDYSDLVACYSTPSDAVFSPETFGVDGGEEEVVASIRALPQAASEGSAGARAKLQRAKTAKLQPPQIRGAGGGVQRGKTVSTASSASAEPASRLGPGLGGKGTMHHSVLKKQPSARQQPEQMSPPSAAKNMYPYTSTQPLRLNKSEVAIPQRGSSSPTKPRSSFPTGTVLPSSLRIASPELLTNPYIQHQGFPPFPHPHHPHYGSETSASPPKKTKAVSNRSNGDENKSDMGARTVVQKAKNRSTALHTVDHIVSQSYAQHHQHYSS
ncbi:uncharacterized protein UBRO_05883 [Ustilago bromivora]|uniref:Uncharacterized protein n=1 Tax=Ustilago bromivora TaxID=307758 RepID=A0A1K0GAI4_9BASI|nr:uncharacterized protein UBRO_05883 [Ustilago bromivora]SYW82804.1 uncharacterized protein UBRO2_04926 [Ustilago bromivora]